jgi:phage terminase Nu1 subunit (DNA packaging protein)
MENLNQIECSPGEIAAFLGITDRRLRQLAKEEIIPQKKRGIFLLQNVVQAYITFLKQGTSMRGKGTGEGDKLDYNIEKTLLTKAQREKAELEVKVMKGELHRGEDVKTVMGDIVAAFRAKIMSIPTKLAPRLLVQTDMAIIQDMLKQVHNEALMALSEYKPTAFHSKNKNVLVGKVDLNE